MIGLVSSNALVTLFQVTSRVMVVCGVLIGVEGASESKGIHFLLFAWTVTEIIRYSFYAMGIFGISLYPLVWCRLDALLRKRRQNIKTSFLQVHFVHRLVPDWSHW
jgi:very-long-chain (3R)-3-hydroxyacyl-CoA dehydratase